MELDFDKEINALLRQAARNGEFVSTNTDNHLDADEISAFAENALPEKTRAFFIKHFADCDRCRTILSNTILLNSEAENKTASSVVTAVETKTIAAQIPWYRKLFLMPNLAYTMGALVLVFGGMLGFIALQSLNQTGSSDVSQIQNAPTRSSGPNASDEGLSYNSNAASAVSNSAASSNATAMTNSSANTTANSSNAMSTNTSASVQNTPADKPENESSTADIAAAPRDKTLAKQSKENDFLTDGADDKKLERKEETFAEKNKQDAEVSRSDDAAKTATAAGVAPPAAPAAKPAENQLPINGRQMQRLPETTARAKRRDNAISSANINTRQIGGKTFNRVGGVWIDSAYNKSGGGSSNMMLPPTRTIRRGSSEYQKLDKQVRIIAESLDGAVVIVWKDGAYRIQ